MLGARTSPGGLFSPYKFHKNWKEVCPEGVEKWDIKKHWFLV
jgi:hypothetical protein